MTSTSNPTRNTIRPTSAQRNARFATYSVFAINGLMLALWVVSIPAIQRTTQVSDGKLGTLLLALGGAGFAGMQIGGLVVDRFGSKPLIITTGIGLAGVTLLPTLATDEWTLAGALVGFGLILGLLDVSMNTHAIAVERTYKRPILSSFHAFFSVGGAVGAFLGAFLFKLGWTPWELVLIGSAITLIFVGIIAQKLMPRKAELATLPKATVVDGSHKNPWWRVSPVILLLGGAAFLLMLAEGVANDWSALQVATRFDAPESVAALGYGVFAVTMTIGRFLTDWVVARTGPVTILRYGSILAGAGLTTVVLSGSLPLTLVGWAVLGIGLSGCVPQLFSAAGNLPGTNAGVTMSRVVGLGYLGQLAGPAVIGWAASATSISTALWIPTIGLVAVILMTTAIRRAMGQSTSE